MDARDVDSSTALQYQLAKEGDEREKKWRGEQSKRDETRGEERVRTTCLL